LKRDAHPDAVTSLPVTPHRFDVLLEVQHNQHDAHPDVSCHTKITTQRFGRNAATKQGLFHNSNRESQQSSPLFRAEKRGSTLFANREKRRFGMRAFQAIISCPPQQHILQGRHQAMSFARGQHCHMSGDQASSGTTMLRQEWQQLTALLSSCHLKLQVTLAPTSGRGGSQVAMGHGKQ